jgi:chaperonin GroEL
MRNKIVKFDNDVYEDIKIGVDILAQAVRTTMGPRGKTVLIERQNQHPLVTKDGVTVAKHLNLKNQFQNLGVQVIKEAAQRSADEAGDGTTTATVLAHAILEKGLQMIAAGKDAVKLRKSIENATKKVIENLKKSSSKIKNNKELKQIALISCNGEEEIADLIVTGIKNVGVDGSIIVENAKGYKSELTLVEGLQLNRGYLSPYFVNNQDKMICSFEKSLVLLIGRKVESLKELLKPLEFALSSEKQVLLIVDDIEDEVLQGLVLNKTKGNLKVCVIKSPGFGNNRHDMLVDLSSITGAKIFDNSSDIKEFKEEDFGILKKCIISRNSSLFLADNDRQDDINKRIDFIKDRLANEMLEENDIIAINHRLTQLSGGIALLRVGASTEAEMLERRDRVDDALSATRAALQEGIVAGGGVAIASAILNIKPELIDDQIGFDILKHACFAPITQIVKNTGKSADLVIEKIHESGKKDYGYDASNENFGNMFELGVIDPLKVVRCALQNASSAATLLLTSECAMIDENKNE